MFSVSYRAPPPAPAIQPIRPTRSSSRTKHGSRRSASAAPLAPPPNPSPRLSVTCSTLHRPSRCTRWLTSRRRRPTLPAAVTVTRKANHPLRPLTKLRRSLMVISLLRTALRSDVFLPQKAKHAPSAHTPRPPGRRRLITAVSFSVHQADLPLIGRAVHAAIYARKTNTRKKRLAAFSAALRAPSCKRGERIFWDSFSLPKEQATTEGYT